MNKMVETKNNLKVNGKAYQLLIWFIDREVWWESIPFSSSVG